MTDAETPPTPPPRRPRRSPPRSSTRTPRRRRARFEIGRALGSTFQIWFRNFVPFTLLGLIVFLPSAGWHYWSGATGGFANESTEAQLGIETLINTLLSTLLGAPLIGAVFAELRGRRMAFGAALGSGLGRIVPAFGVALLLALIETALSLAGTVVPMGLFVVYVPMLVIQCGLIVAVPAAVVERPGVFGALRRSWLLTNGSKASIFVILLLFGLILGGGTVALAVVHAVVTGTDADDFADLPWWLMYPWQAVVMVASAVLSGVLYHDLRIAVDGADPAEVIAVFD